MSLQHFQSNPILEQLWSNAEFNEIMQQIVKNVQLLLKFCFLQAFNS